MESRLKAYQQFSGKQVTGYRCQNKALQMLEIHFKFKFKEVQAPQCEEMQS